MNLQLEHEEGVVVATILTDTLDAATVSDFRHGVAPAIGDKVRLVLDLTHVTFVDSSGLGAILACLRELNAVGGDLRLATVREPVQRVFDLVRMHRVLGIFPSRREAMEGWGQGHS